MAGPQGPPYTEQQDSAFQPSFIINMCDGSGDKADVLHVDGEQSSGKPNKVSQS